MGFLILNERTISIKGKLLSDGIFTLKKEFKTRNNMSQIGNSFVSRNMNFGKARKVWRSVRHVYPCGGTILNVSDFAAKGVIPAGSAVKFDAKKKQITVITENAIKGAGDAKTLGINGYLQEDIPLTNANTIATGAVVYAGELYGYMFDDAVVEKLKSLTSVPEVVFVY